METQMCPGSTGVPWEHFCGTIMGFTSPGVGIALEMETSVPTMPDANQNLNFIFRRDFQIFKF